MNRIRQFWNRLLGPTPRNRPKGSDPNLCDGCDAPSYSGPYVARLRLINGGYYCDRCAEEVRALTPVIEQLRRLAASRPSDGEVK